MDMLLGDPPSSIYTTQDVDMTSILDENAVIHTSTNTLNEQGQHHESSIYYLPTVLTRLQKELAEVVVQLFSTDLVGEVRSKRLRTSIDSLLESVTNSSNSLSSFDKVTLLFDQLSIINNHPSLLVDHFMPKKLLLLDVSERLVAMSGKFHLFNRIVDSLIESEHGPGGFHVLVVAQSVKEIELIEGLIIGKRIYYNNFSNAKLYNDNRGIPDFHNPKNKKLKDKVCLYLVTSQQLYNNYVPSSGNDNSKFNLIFSFDIKLDVTSPSVELLRGDTEETPIYIAVPVFSIEHVQLQFPEPRPSLNYEKDTSNPLFKWKLQVINAFIVNRFNLFEIEDKTFFLDVYGGRMSRLQGWFNRSNALFPSLLQDYDKKLNLHFTDEKLIKKLNSNYSTFDIIHENFKLKSYDYKSYKEKLAEILNLRLDQIETTTYELHSKIPHFREIESKRQIQYDFDEDKIADSYRKLRRLNEDAGFAEKKLGRIETDLVRTVEKKTELERRNSFLVEHNKEATEKLKELTRNQEKSLDELQKELCIVESEFNKLNEENDAVRQKYQNSSTTAVQLSSQLHKLKEQNIKLEAKLNGPGMRSLPVLIHKDSSSVCEHQLKRLKTNNNFLSLFLQEKIEKLSKERQIILETTATGSSSRPSNRISRASTPM